MAAVAFVVSRLDAVVIVARLFRQLPYAPAGAGQDTRRPQGGCEGKASGVAAGHQGSPYWTLPDLMAGCDRSGRGLSRAGLRAEESAGHMQHEGRGREQL